MAAVPSAHVVVKRGREEGTEQCGQYSAYFRCGEWSSLVTLYRPITTEMIEEKLFRGVDFFFSPHVSDVVGSRLVLTICESGTPCDKLFKDRPWKPCSVHGPFRCSCHALEHVARQVIQLQRELLWFQGKLEVFDREEAQHPDTPFFQVDVAGGSVSLVLCGLPFPERRFGPFPLFSVDSRYSIGKAIAAASITAETTEPAVHKCVLCSISAESRCCICRCIVCAECGSVCDCCMRGACRACVVTDIGPQQCECALCIACHNWAG
ncbi:hypothetical protein, conserved [Trypanosoma brucei brucei TREU927]|uniref:Uncharacterized protein n=1 Tax=Trypanosoma brucei brucei (strain 927/4 GUTat10.1) TaxID=185431 RepID=Q57UB3_TRYB2|nr:hypothetical protein, conserved [Trypanosoma brucei brucei TREU927]AAX70806.1 hypothetical protein, conserved [Trypanosoma brucei]AAZ11464.1 hypothetical protein, conserved [Trypanosoma brucei brucei TREU927]